MKVDKKWLSNLAKQIRHEADVLDETIDIMTARYLEETGAVSCNILELQRWMDTK